MTKRVSEEMQLEVLLMFGDVARQRTDNISRSRRFPLSYWKAVREFLGERYPGLFRVKEYPDRGYTDEDHKADMDILVEIHRWQIENRLKHRRKNQSGQ